VDNVVDDDVTLHQVLQKALLARVANDFFDKLGSLGLFAVFQRAVDFEGVDGLVGKVQGLLFADRFLFAAVQGGAHFTFGQELKMNAKFKLGLGTY